MGSQLIHDVEVVDEPFRGGCDRALFTDGVGNHVVRLAEHMAVVLDARRQSPPAPSLQDPLGGGEALGMLFEALDAEQLGTDRGFTLEGLAAQQHGTFLKG